MKYNYKFSEITYKSGRKSLIIEVDKEIQLVANFLMSDIQGSDPSYVYEAIDKVINEESSYEEINGNMCGVEIRKDYTMIYNNLAPDGIGNYCRIETSELREFIEKWNDKIIKYKTQQGC